MGVNFLNSTTSNHMKLSFNFNAKNVLPSEMAWGLMDVSNRLMIVLK